MTSSTVPEVISLLSESESELSSPDGKKLCTVSIGSAHNWKKLDFNDVPMKLNVPREDDDDDDSDCM